MLIARNIAGKVANEGSDHGGCGVHRVASG